MLKRSIYLSKPEDGLVVGPGMIGEINFLGVGVELLLCVCVYMNMQMHIGYDPLGKTFTVKW